MSYTVVTRHRISLCFQINDTSWSLANHQQTSPGQVYILPALLQQNGRGAKCFVAQNHNGVCPKTYNGTFLVHELTCINMRWSGNLDKKFAYMVNGIGIHSLKKLHISAWLLINGCLRVRLPSSYLQHYCYYCCFGKHIQDHKMHLWQSRVKTVQGALTTSLRATTNLLLSNTVYTLRADFWLCRQFYC